MNRRRLGVGILTTAGVMWGAMALGSYVFLTGMGNAEDFEFPWNQLAAAIPGIINDGWYGFPALKVWYWASIGTFASAFPLLMLVKILWQRRRGRSLRDVVLDWWNEASRPRSH